MTVNSVNSRLAARGYPSNMVVRAGLFVCVFLLYSSLLPFATVAFGIPATPAYLAIVLAAMLLSSGIFMAQPILPASKFVIGMLGAYLALIFAQAVVVPPATPDILKFRIFWALVTASAIIVLQNVKERDLVWAMRLVVAFSILMILLEYGSRFSLPVDMTTVKGRAAGLYMNPNTAAFFICAAIPLVTLRASVFVRLTWYLMVGIAVQLTFSRGGMLMLISMVAMAEMFTIYSEKNNNKFAKLFVLAFLSITIYSIYAVFIKNAHSILARMLDENTANRLQFAVNESSMMRIYVLERAIDVAKSSILFGKGIGFAYSWSEGISVHNMFALILLEQGILGLLWMSILFVALFSLGAPIGIWISTIIIVGGMFSHNLFDSPTYGLVIALYAALPSILRASDRGR